MEQQYFELKIDYKENSRNPEVIFDTMSKLISTMRNIDEMMVESIVAIEKIEIELDSIEIGSIKTRLKTMIEVIPDSAIENLDIKNFIGSYLLKGKYFLIDRLSEKETISSSQEVKEIKQGLERIGLDEIGETISVSQTKLLENFCDLSNTVKQLDKEDKVVYICGSGVAVINKDFDLKMSKIEELISFEAEEITSTNIVQIKKPDYLGNSKWEFYCDHQVISAKILDDEWLKRYQSGNIDIRPGDSLSVLLKMQCNRDEYGQILHVHYDVLKVREVVRNMEVEQIEFIEESIT